ncbi:hypothetical protein N1851_033464 [Merluccius polli]|uniref:CCHC-type domain-containing protein n=1 Tax=Merluccius polli TaxID=89951 RepID=A0AA47NMK5_MERPO|nr:hypothetical protein N1851_033464 [Merluccius polli]
MSWCLRCTGSGSAVGKEEIKSHVEFVQDLTAHFGLWCAASEVDTFEKLCDLVILGQFKKSVPKNVATCITENKVGTPGQAAVLADEYVLIHKSNFNALGSDNVRRESYGHQKGASDYYAKSEHGMRERQAEGRTCNYCKGSGHWKSECPVLKSKSTFSGAQVRPAALANSLSPGVVVAEQVEPRQQKSMEDFGPFISEGLVSLPGSVEQVPVKILRDTGSLDSFVRESVLPFSSETDTGDFVFIRGMGMVVFLAPVHRLCLVSGLMKGDVEMGVRTELPVDGVDIILGNGLAGVRVWADGPPPNIVTKSVPGQDQPQCIRCCRCVSGLCCDACHDQCV